MRWKKKSNFLKMLWNILYKNNENLLCQIVLFVVIKDQDSLKVKKWVDYLVYDRSNCAVCGDKRSRFIKSQEASGLFTILGIRNPLTNIPLVCGISF